MKALPNTQVVFATHSVQFLDPQFEPTVYSLRRDKNGATKVKFTSPDEIVEAYHLVGQKPGVFAQADIVIFTEGPTDVPVFEEWVRQILEKEGLADNPNLVVLCKDLGGDSGINQERLTPESLKKITAHPLVIIDGERDNTRALREQIQKKLKEGKVHCTLTNRCATENYFTLPAIQTVYSKCTSLPPHDTPIDKDSVLGYSKRKNGKIAKAMSVEDLKETDIWCFLQEVVKTCRNVLNQDNEEVDST
jgi:hypothetical protein